MRAQRVRVITRARARARKGSSFYRGWIYLWDLASMAARNREALRVVELATRISAERSREHRLTREEYTYPQSTTYI